MKLKKLTITNFRGLRGGNNVIDFLDSNIIFLIGQNNCGKSSFLRAYEFFVNSGQKAEKVDFYNQDETIPIEIEGEFLKEDEDVDDEDLKGSGKNQEPDWIDKWVDGNNIVRIKKEWLNASDGFKRYTFDPSIHDWVLNGFGGFHTKFQKYAPQSISISAMDTEQSLEDKVNDLIKKELLKQIKTNNVEEYQYAVNAIKLLQGKIIDSDIIEKYNESINRGFREVFSDLKLEIKEKGDDGIDIEKAFQKNHSISVITDGIERKETFFQHGHGVIRQAFFNFLAFLNKDSESTRKEYLILFEEPEIFLHPKVLVNLRKCLYKLSQDSPYQIICATHSPGMIDISKPHSSLVRVVKNKDTKVTTTHQVGDNLFQRDEDIKNFVHMINRFNPHVCEAFYADDVLLVEGDTEAVVYRELLEKFFMGREIFVLNTGSKSNIPFFQEILTHFRIKHCVIHDVDDRFCGDGSRTNPMWTINERIWEKIQEANTVIDGMARRYVHHKNFEEAHGYSIDSSEGKPLSAYKFAQEVQSVASVDCLRWIEDYIGTRTILHDQEYIESL